MGTFDDKIIGILAIHKAHDTDKSTYGKMEAIYLLSEFAGNGYGKKMTAFAVEQLNGLGYKDILLRDIEENARARRFYKKCGLLFDGEKREVAIGKPLTEI